MNTKHINIFLTALTGQSSQGRTLTRPRDKRDKMAILLWNSTENGRFVPRTGPSLSQGRIPVCPGDGFLFVLRTVPPKMFMFIGFFLPEQKSGRSPSKTFSRLSLTSHTPFFKRVHIQRRVPVGGGKTGSICHFAFSLALQGLGVPKDPDAGKNSTKSVIVIALFLCPKC